MSGRLSTRLTKMYPDGLPDGADLSQIQSILNKTAKKNKQKDDKKR